MESGTKQRSVKQMMYSHNSIAMIGHAGDFLADQSDLVAGGVKRRGISLPMECFAV